MTKAEERLVEWLRDGPAEEQAATMLCGFADRLDRYQAPKQRAASHFKETRRRPERVRECIGRRNFEAMKSAACRVLVKAAEPAGDNETASVCAQNLHEEEEMARWITERIDSLTAKHLQREDAGVTAKH
ncbi:MAG: DUF892 family protein [Pseudomonadota bacterium]